MTTRKFQIRQVDLTLPELAQKVLHLQSACNLSGVAGFLVSLTSRLWDEARALGHGTGWVNKHPLVVATINQAAHLSGVQIRNYEVTRDALDWCHNAKVSPITSWEYEQKNPAPIHGNAEKGRT